MELLPSPSLRNGRVYYYRNVTVTSVPWSGGDPSSGSSFGAPRTELAGDAIPAGGPLLLAPGLVTALGQPTFAKRPDGSTEMVFVYYRRTATGFLRWTNRARPFALDPHESVFALMKI